MRRFALILCAVIGAAILFYGSVWLWAWSRLGSQIDRAIARHEAAGGTFAATELTVGGFPFSLGVAATDLVVVQPDGVTWRSPQVSGRTDLWAIDLIRLSAENGVEIAIPIGADLSPVIAVSEHGSGVIDHDFGQTAATLTLRFNDVEVRPSHGPAATADSVTFVVAGADPQSDARNEEMSLSVDATTVAVPQTARIGLDDDIEEFGVTLSLVGPPPSAFHRRALDLWRRGGGSVRVDRLHLLWGELGLAGQGTAALDDGLQPLVRLDTEIRGLNPTLAALTQSGTLSTGVAAAIGVGVGFLGALTGQAGGTALAIEVADRRVSIGSALLPGRLPEVNWPEALPPPATN